MTDNDGPTIRTYNSLEEMLADQRKEEERANAVILPKQREITWGSYTIRVSQGFVIFTSVYTEDGLRQSEIDCGASPGEADRTMDRMREIHERGYRTGTHYSQVEPDGELGDLHISVAWPITKEDFEEARERGWTVSLALMQKLGLEMDAEMDEYEARREAREKFIRDQG